MDLCDLGWLPFSKRGLSVTFSCLSQHAFDQPGQPPNLPCPIYHYLVLYYLLLPLPVTFITSSREGEERRQGMMEGGWREAGWKAKSMICIFWVTVSEWKRNETHSDGVLFLKVQESVTSDSHEEKRGKRKERAVGGRGAKIKGKVSDRCLCKCVYVCVYVSVHRG